MLTALVVACVAQLPTAWQPRTQGSSFELTLPASPEQMRQAFTRPRGTQQLVWIPGVQHAPAQDVTFTEGPVRRLQVLPKKRGVIVLLNGRHGAPIAAKTALLASPALLRVGPPLPAPAPAPLPQIGTAATIETSEKVETLMPAAAAMPLADDAPHAWTQDSAFGMKPTTWVVWGVGCTFLLAIAFLVRQRAKPHEHGSIEIVAVRSLSARHKLALVTAGGERLLLATTDKEVILLSHLGPAGAEDLEDSAAPEAPGAKVFKLPTRGAAKAPVPRAPTPSGFAPDVMGLLRLKRPAAVSA